MVIYYQEIPTKNQISVMSGLSVIKEIILGNNQEYYAELFKLLAIPIRANCKE